MIYLQGNHDAPLQKYDGLSIGDIKVVRETVHTTEHGIYINDGDWVENWMALCESMTGDLQLVHWVETRVKYDAKFSLKVA